MYIIEDLDRIWKQIKGLGLSLPPRYIPPFRSPSLSFSHSISRTTRARALSLRPSSHCPLLKVFRGEPYFLTFVKKKIAKNPPKMPTLAPAQ